MMQKICRAFLFFLLFSNALFASDKWVVASLPFSFSSYAEQTKVNESLKTVIPKLILEQLSANLTRLSFENELLDRELFKTKQKRLDLFLQLSNEVKKRDSLVLRDYSKKVLEAKIKESEKKIASLKNDIEQNLVEEDSLFQKKIEVEEKNVIQSDNSVLEDVALYKDSFTELFLNTEEIASNQFEKSVVSSGINALLSGVISVYDGYISASVSLTVYPGVRLAGSATDVDSVQNIHLLAARLARSLIPHITNSVPIQLVLEVYPEAARNNMIFSLDDVAYKELPSSLIVSQGVHSISFSSPGFSRIGTTYSFSKSKKFFITATLSEENESSFFIKSKVPLNGVFYTQDHNGSSVTKDDGVAKLTINNQSVLGMFISEDGFYSPFYVEQKLLVENASFVAALKNFDKDAYINKRRKRMYASYSALVISLMGTFFSYGRRESSFPSGAQTTYNAWNVATYSFIGVSAVCGVWFIYELCRYLIAADSTIPAKAKKSKEDFSIQYVEKIIDKTENEKTGDK